MNIDFTNRRVIVTGGAGYLGSAIADTILAAGGFVAVPCEHERELERVGGKGHPQLAAFGPVNLADESAVESFFDDACATWGSTAAAPPWAVINAAGGFAWKPLLEMNAAVFTDQWRMNALTNFLCTLAGVRRMVAQKSGGRIVSVTARPALEPRLGANMSAYTASKAAVASLTQSLAEELASSGILVNAVVPSVMDTPANRRDMAGQDPSKWAKVSEVAATVAFLASPQNAVTRGGLVPVYGQT